MADYSKRPNIFNLGISHKSANVTFRESLYIPDEEIQELLPLVRKKYDLDELSILSTCNRFEMFGVSARQLDDNGLFDLFASIQDLKKTNSVESTKDTSADRISQLKKNSYIYRDHTAVHHILSVAASLDSLVVGETQITNQFKKSIALAKSVGSIGSILDRLSQDSLACAKKVRRNTDIGKKTVSISHAAIDLAKKIFGDISQQRIMIIGAGEMSSLAAKYAASYKPKSLMILNRTQSKAKALVEEIKFGTYHSLDELEFLLAETDIVISSTSSNEVIIKKKHISALERSDDFPLFLCDIAIPRDIDPTISEFEDVFLFEVDDLKKVVNDNIEERKSAAKDGLVYVGQASDHFMEWLSLHDIKPILSSAKAQVEEFLEKEYKKTLGKQIFRDLNEEQIAALHDLKKAIGTKLIGKVAKSISNESDSKFELVKFVKAIYIDD